MNNNLLFNDIVILVDEVYKGQDKYGNNLYEETKTKLFCNAGKVKRQEFYNAGNSGYKIAFNIVINDFEYKNQEKAIYKDKKFSIIKTYPLNNGVIELTLGERVGDRSDIV